MAPVLADVRWHCQHYNAMASLTALIDPKTYEGGFYRAVLAVHAGRFDEAATQRWEVLQQLSAATGHGYQDQ